MFAAETTGTSLTELVNSEFIAPLIIDYAIDKMVITPLMRVQSIAGMATKTVAFPRWIKDAGADVTEATDISNTELESSENTAITAAQVAILREVTDLALQTNMLGPQGLVDFILRDGAMLCAEMLEDDLAGTFASASGSVGTSGVDLSVANFIEAMAKLDTNNVRGEKVCVLDDQQALDIRNAVAASAASVFANAASGAQTVLNARSDAYVGELFGVRTWLTNLTDTANSGADVVGAMMINGSSAPNYAPIGVALLWEPKLKQVEDVETLSTKYAIYMAYGQGEINDPAYVKIVTDA